MNLSKQTVEIYNLHRGAPVEALLFDGIEERHLVDFESKWKPILCSKENEIRVKSKANGNLDKDFYLKELGRFGLQDWHWDWRKKNSIIEGQLSYKSYSIECENILQGLMCVNLSKLGRIPSQLNFPLVYVEFLNVAPWNRYPLEKMPKYKYIGHVLIATAISLSIEEEFKGRIGLHSLPQAAGFYSDKVGLQNLGPDKSHENLCYFEMTPQEAIKFLNP